MGKKGELCGYLYWSFQEMRGKDILDKSSLFMD